MSTAEQSEDIITGHTRSRTPSLLTRVVLHSVHLQSSDDEASPRCHCAPTSVVDTTSTPRTHRRHVSENELCSPGSVVTTLQCDDVVQLFYKGNKYHVPRHFFTNEHPGGAAMIRRYLNTDITSVFNRFHSSRDARYVLEQWRDEVGSDDDDDDGREDEDSSALPNNAYRTDTEGGSARTEVIRGRLRNRAAHAMAVIHARRQRSRNRMIQLCGGALMACIVCYRLRKLILLS